MGAAVPVSSPLVPEGFVAALVLAVDGGGLRCGVAVMTFASASLLQAVLSLAVVAALIVVLSVATVVLLVLVALDKGVLVWSVFLVSCIVLLLPLPSSILSLLPTSSSVAIIVAGAGAKGRSPETNTAKAEPHVDATVSAKTLWTAFARSAG